MEKTYTLALTSFILSGQDGFDALRGPDVENISPDEPPGDR